MRPGLLIRATNAICTYDTSTEEVALARVIEVHEPDELCHHSWSLEMFSSYSSITNAQTREVYSNGVNPRIPQTEDQGE
jgi:hypothetical protein